ncbi:hypothetical protein CR969_02760 [Candidatus Saccharibacteria bacterium]|nr:MAG: hypothetical protein CR969_02760 [Candidatus Saccharibacteria bacterium]
MTAITYLIFVDKSDLIEKISSGKLIDSSSLKDDQVAEFEQLLSAGIIEPKFKPSSKYTVYVEYDGLSIKLAESKKIKFTDDKTKADRALIICYKSNLGKIVNKIADLELPHLFIDVSFHHTVSLGPIVVPHQTACVSCLYGRLRERWGITDPVKQPLVVNQYPDLVKEIINTELDRFLDGDMSLVGKTCSIDIVNRKTLDQKLLTVNDCPYCKKDFSRGKISL